MASRLYTYVFGDAVARRRGDRVTLAIAGVWCSVELLLSAPVYRVVWEGVGVVVAGMVITTFWYCMFSHSVPEISKVKPLVVMTRAAYVRLVLAIFGGALGLPVIEAAIIKQKLKDSLREPITEKSLQVATGVIDNAVSSRIFVQPQKLSDASRFLSDLIADNSINPSVRQSAVGTLISLETYRELSEYSYSSGAVSISDHTGFKVGEATLIANITFLGGPQGSQAIALPPPDFGLVVVCRVHIRNLIQALDRITWLETTFEHCQVFHEGGEFKLADVKFTDCEFFPAGSKFAREMNIRSRQGFAVSLDSKSLT